MRLRCRIGIHRWQFVTKHGYIFARCKHRCERYPNWAAVARDED